MDELGAVEALEARMRLLDDRLKPIANGTVDLSQEGWAQARRRPDPLAEAGVKAQAQELLGAIVEAYAAASDEDRERIRGLFERYAAFAWAAALPEPPTTPKGLRRHLLHFAIVDQGTDSRDAVLWLDALCAKAAKAGLDPKPFLKEAAAVSSDRDKYGMGSTRRQLSAAAARRWR